MLETCHTSLQQPRQLSLVVRAFTSYEASWHGLRAQIATSYGYLSFIDLCTRIILVRSELNHWQRLAGSRVSHDAHNLTCFHCAYGAYSAVR